jgi:hypothetical protein
MKEFDYRIIENMGEYIPQIAIYKTKVNWLGKCKQTKELEWRRLNTKR